MIRDTLKSLKKKLKDKVTDLYKGIKFRRYNRDFPDILRRQMSYDTKLLEAEIERSPWEKSQHGLFGFTVRIYEKEYCPAEYYEYERLNKKNQGLYQEARTQIDFLLIKIAEHKNG